MRVIVIQVDDDMGDNTTIRLLLYKMAILYCSPTSTGYGYIGLL